MSSANNGKGPPPRRLPDGETARGAVGRGDETAFDEGYRLGYDAAHIEVRQWDGRHERGCGCDPCISVRAILQMIHRRLEAK